MTVHIIVFVYMCMIGCVIYQGRAYAKEELRHKNKAFLILAEVFLFLIFALRSYRVSLDGPTYYVYYLALKNIPGFSVSWEPLFRLIYEIAIKLDWYQFVIIATSLITCIGFGYFAYRNCDDTISAFWFIIFYITLNQYFNSMNLLRQICSTAICVNIYTVLKNDQTRRGYIKSLILLLLGMGFHIMAVLALVYVLPLYFKSVSKKTIAYAAIAAVIGIALFAIGQRIVIGLVPRFARYINDDRLSNSRAGIFSVAMIAIKLLLIILTLTLNPNLPENKEIYRLTFMTVFGTAFYILQFKTQFALRIGYYVEIFFPLYIPTFIRKWRWSSSRFILYSAMFLFGAVYFVYMLKWGGIRSNRGCVPYLFFWQSY